MLNSVVPTPLVIGNGIITDGMGLFIENGAVRIENGRIAWVGPAREVNRNDAQFIDVGGRLVMPGFLNFSSTRQ